MKPIIQALVLADRVYEDKVGKKIICGTFNRISTGKVATQQVQMPGGGQGTVMPGGSDPGCPWAYVSLTDVMDNTTLTLEYSNIGDNTSIFQVSVQIQNNDRLATIEIVVPLPPMTVFAPKSGTYSLDVLWNKEIIGSHRVVVEATT